MPNLNSHFELLQESSHWQLYFLVQTKVRLGIIFFRSQQEAKLIADRI